jgi:phage tail-like protein
MAFKRFWDDHLLFNMLPDNLRSLDKQDLASVINPVVATLAGDITSTQTTIQIVPAQVLDTSGYLYLGSNNEGIEQIYYNYNVASPYYLTNCIRNYNNSSSGSQSFSTGTLLYMLPKAEGPLSRFLRIIEPSFDTLYETITTMSNLKDPKTCPSALLPYLATERGWADLDLTKDITYQRKFIDFLPEIYKNKGLKSGLIDLIYLVGVVKGQVFNYWDFSFFIEELYGHPSYISISAVTDLPDEPRIYQVRVPTFSVDYDEIRKVMRYARPACQTGEILWTLLFDDFSIELPEWALAELSIKTYTNSNTLILERGIQ